MNKQKIIIIDYGAGNLKSAANMLDYLGADYEITDDASKIKKADRIIFPGQGHFAQAADNLKKKGLDEAIKEVCFAGRPFLGICIGLQILFEESEEAPNAKGLGIFKGGVKKFQGVKTPQTGWSRIVPVIENSNIPEGYYYFVNSYYAVPKDKSIISAIGEYGIKYCAAVQKDNITAVQFHPEKSAENGAAFFRNLLKQ